MTKRQRQIVARWKLIEESEPDISTEQLLHRVEIDCHASTDEVCAALEAEGKIIHTTKTP